MMPPTSIDSTDITGATIDGTDVTEITVDGQTVFTSTPTLSPNCVHRWTFDNADISGNTVFDTVGNIDGTISGGVTTGVAGVFGEGIKVDGDADGEVDFGSIPTCESATKFSLSIFVKDVSAAADWDRSIGNIFGDFRDFNDNIILGATDTSANFTRVERSGSRAQVFDNITFGSSYKHYVLVWDAPSMEVYYDGSSIATANGPSQSMSSTDFYIAYRKGGSGFHTNCTVDDARIYDKALTAQEVTNLKNTGSIL